MGEALEVMQFLGAEEGLYRSSDLLGKSDIMRIVLSEGEESDIESLGQPINQVREGEEISMLGICLFDDYYCLAIVANLLGILFGKLAYRLNHLFLL